VVKSFEEEYQAFLDEGGEPDDPIRKRILAIAHRLGLWPMLTEEQVRSAVQKTIELEVPAWHNFCRGEAHIINYLVGKVLRRTGKRTDPKAIQRLLEEAKGEYHK